MGLMSFLMVGCVWVSVGRFMAWTWDTDDTGPMDIHGNEFVVVV